MSEPMMSGAELRRQCQAALPGLRWSRPNPAPGCTGRLPKAPGYFHVTAEGKTYTAEMVPLVVAFFSWHEDARQMTGAFGDGLTVAAAVEDVLRKIAWMEERVAQARTFMLTGRTAS